MKIKHIYSFVILLASTLFTACTDVVDVDVPTGKPRLVVEASIEWEKGSEGKYQEIKLSMLTPYFSNNDHQGVEGASVIVTNTTSGDSFEFEDKGNGLYTTNSFVPVLFNNYELTIINNGKTYKAKEMLMSVPELQDIDQSTERGFSSEEMEVNLYFKDPEQNEDFYLFRFYRIGDLLPSLIPISDEFTNGNVMDISFEKEDDADTSEQEELKPGDVVEYEMHGISERYYNFVQIMVNQLGAEASIFSGVPVELKGNCINVDDKTDFTLGYFRLTETVKGTYNIQ